MFSIMEYVTTTVERHWTAHKAAASSPGAPLFLGRSIMLIDEAWHLISRPETGEYANNLARRARHLGLVLIVMSQQLSDFDTEYGVALLGNSSQQLLLAQNPKEIPFIAETVQLSEREAAELQRLKTVKGRHAQMLWLNGTRGHGKVALRVGPTEYWAFTSDPTEVAIREAEIAATTATCGRRSRSSPSAAPAPTANGKATRWEQHRPARTERAPLADQPRAVTRHRDERHLPPAARPGPILQRCDHDALLTGLRAPRSAAGGVRAVRRRRRQHPRLPDRARGRTARRPARCWSPTPAGRAAGSPATPACGRRGR